MALSFELVHRVLCKMETCHWEHSQHGMASILVKLTPAKPELGGGGQTPLTHSPHSLTHSLTHVKHGATQSTAQCARKHLSARSVGSHAEGSRVRQARHSSHSVVPYTQAVTA